MLDMNLNDAKMIVEKKIIAQNQDCALMSDATIEYVSCFVFYYQSKKFIESGNSDEMYVGHGPVILCKNTGQVFKTGSVHSTEHYVNAFETCGDPHGELTNKVEVIGWMDGARTVEAIKYIKKVSGLGLSKAKGIIDFALQDKSSIFDLSDVDKAKEVVQKLNEIGFKTKQLWSNQC